MTPRRLVASAAAILCLCVLSATQVFAENPTGTLTTPQAFVQAGTKPNLTWDINYPPYRPVIIDPPGTVIPTTTVNMEVRLIGASVKVVWLNAIGKILKSEWAPTETYMSINKGSYSKIFSATQSTVSGILPISRVVQEGQEINFGGRYYFDGNWSNFYKSGTRTQNVVALVKGDMPPTTVPLYQQPTIEDFIKPYLDSSGRINIGDRDVIYLMELTHTDKRDGGFDLQDLALLVTFTPVTK